MRAMQCLRAPWMVPALSGAIVLGLVASVNADPRPLSKEEQARVDQAIDRAVAFLKRTQTGEGDWPRHYPRNYLVGQCALPAYALLEAGVPPDDPVIQKAADFLRTRVQKNDQTYEISLALLFFDRLGNNKDRRLIQSLALRLIAGQHRSGGWSYRCLQMSEGNEEALLNSLKELIQETKSGAKTSRERLRAIKVPQALRFLTVFQDQDKFDWVEQSNSDLKRSQSLVVGTDNSNTQFAMLGLWAARRHNIPLDMTFRLLVERFERTQFSDGWWPYGGVPRSEVHHTPSMICVGLLGLAIGSGLELTTPVAARPNHEQLRILRGLAALSREIGNPSEGARIPLSPENLYFLWSVERVGMTYDLAMIGDKDWYRWGAELLITNQKPGGGWTAIPGYGAVLNTSFALLFLQRAHPMKELTPKLPFTAKELSQGITRLRSGDPSSERSNGSFRNRKSSR